jgi:hypothetical protein
VLLRDLVVKLRAVEDTHDHGASAVSTLVLGEVVAARELLAAVGALKGLVVSVERAVVALKVFLATEAARAESADEGLGGILGQRLLAAATARGSNGGSGGCLLRAGVGGVVLTREV